MRPAATLILLALALAAGGCGGETAQTTTATRAMPNRAAATTEEPQLRVAFLGSERVGLPGVAPAKSLGDADLVVVGPHVRGVRTLASAHPDAHFVLVGRSFRRAGAARDNIAGLLFRTDQAAYLAGVVAALASTEGGALDARVAWVGTERHRIAAAFARGARAADPRVEVVDVWTVPAAARCKEAALDAIARGAAVIFGGTGACADGALAAAHDQNALGLSLADFLHPEVAVDQTVREALRGKYHGAENIVFGAASDAVAVGDLHGRVSADTVVRARQTAQELASGLRSAG